MASPSMMNTTGINVKGQLDVKHSQSVGAASIPSTAAKISPKKEKKGIFDLFLLPEQLIKRQDGEEDFNALNMPVSPAFVNSQKEKEPKLKKQLDECLLKNIPFCAEEDKYYRFRQFGSRFGHYKQALDECYETDVPSQFDIGMRLLTNHPKKEKLSNVTDGYTSKKIYFP